MCEKRVSRPIRDVNGTRGVDSQKAVPVIHKCAVPDLFSFQSVTDPCPQVRVADRGDRRWTGATPPFCCPVRARGCCAIHIAQHPLGGSLPSKISLAGRQFVHPMKWPYTVLILADSSAMIWRTKCESFPGPGSRTGSDLLSRFARACRAPGLVRLGFRHCPRAYQVAFGVRVAQAAPVPVN